VGLIICLDSGCQNYDQFWLTTSLRGVIGGTLKVSLLSEGIHSGAGTGIYASTFRVARQLLDRVEDVNTGKILVPELYIDIPELRVKQAKESASFLGDTIYKEFPARSGVKPLTEDVTELLLNKTWRPTLAVTGAGGFPPIEKAGNVLRKESLLKISIRIPPGVDAKVAFDAVHKKMTENAPYGAHVDLINDGAAAGWQAPLEEEWLQKSIHHASHTFYNKPAALIGEGGSIPFMGMLGKMFPKAMFVITGLLGPKSNAHGPNEFLEIEYAKKLNACVSYIIRDFNLAKSK